VRKPALAAVDLSIMLICPSFTWEVPMPWCGIHSSVAWIPTVTITWSINRNFTGDIQYSIHLRWSVSAK